jgi:hypothetical protein
LQDDLDLAVAEVDAGWSASAVKNRMILGRERGRRLEPALSLLVKLRGEDLTKDPVPCAFADKVLGLAAFRLACLLGARAVYGELASSMAVDEGRLRGIPVLYHRVVPAIINVRRDGLCPMEHLAFRSESDYEFYLALRRRD